VKAQIFGFACDEMLQSGPSSMAKCVNAVGLSKEFGELNKNGKNKAEDSQLWDTFYDNDMAYYSRLLVDLVKSAPQWTFIKSCHSFISGKPKRCCWQKILLGIKSNGGH